MFEIIVMLNCIFIIYVILGSKKYPTTSKNFLRPEQETPFIRRISATIEPSGSIFPSDISDTSSYNDQDMSNKGFIDKVRNYPKAVFFILSNEFCERFSFYGMKAILLIYFLSEYNFSQGTAISLYHAFVCLAYFSPLFGSIAADNYFGRFKVILWVSLIYVFGHALMSIGAIPYLDYDLRQFLDFSGLFVIAIATGGIKPCVSAFAADQFEENQVQERTQFFSFFYFAVNAGSFLAILVTPIIRSRVKCFGSETCFPLAFGVPGILMLCAFLFFLSGWKYYKKPSPPKGNVIFDVVKCLYYAAKGKMEAIFKGNDKKDNWIDYASNKFDSNLILGVKSLVSVSILYGPIVLFWALYDQQGSTWVHQARRMDGRVGSLTILPDQISVLNPIMILVLVPIFEIFIYPIARKFVKVTPLRKMACGGLLAGISFIVAGLVQIEVNKTMEPLPSPNNVMINVFGNSSNDFSIANIDIKSGRQEIPAIYGTLVSKYNNKISKDMNLTNKGNGYVVGIFRNPETNDPLISSFPYKIAKTENGKTRIYFLLPDGSLLQNGYINLVNANGEVENSTKIKNGKFIDINPAFFSSPNYTIYYDESSNTPCSIDYKKCLLKLKIYAQMGAAHVLVLDQGVSEGQIHTIVRANTIHILWQIPQMFIICLGEIMLSITGLEFSYSQSTPNMKSVLQALWLMTVCLGNMIDMSISGTKIIEDPAYELFFYAALMFAVIGVFILLAINYTYVDPDEIAGHKDCSKKCPIKDDSTSDSESTFPIKKSTIDDSSTRSLTSKNN
uniref:Oligopeptide transporter 1 n=1 Tax=Parastrongyloides trichosuri TaxID=131310 RepID=A0A0N4ZUJ0_PARTI